MQLHVSLIYDKKAVVVEHSHHLCLTWIVAGTNGIHVTLFHHCDVTQHEVSGYTTSVQWVGILCVSAFEISTTAVYFKITLAKINLSKSILCRESFLFIAVLRLTESEGIEGRGLCRPKFYARKRSKINGLCLQAIASSKDKVRHQFLYFLATWVKERNSYGLLCSCLITVADGKFYRCSCATRSSSGSPRCDSRLNIMVCQVSLWCSHEANITMNTTHVPHILSFKIGTIAPTNHLYSNVVLTRAYIFCNIKLTDIISTFGITHLMTVYINISSRVDTIKVEEDTLVLPALW